MLSRSAETAGLYLWIVSNSVEWKFLGTIRGAFLVGVILAKSALLDPLASASSNPGWPRGSASGYGC